MVYGYYDCSKKKFCVRKQNILLKYALYFSQSLYPDYFYTLQFKKQENAFLLLPTRNIFPSWERVGIF